MRLARWIAAIVFLLPLAQLARAQQIDSKSMAELRHFHLNDDVMLRYSQVVRESTAHRAHHRGTDSRPDHAAPGALPNELDRAGQVLEASEPLGSMLRAHHLSGREYLSVLLIRMGASESLQRRRMQGRFPEAHLTVPAPKPWVSPENLRYLESVEADGQPRAMRAAR